MRLRNFMALMSSSRATRNGHAQIKEDAVYLVVAQLHMPTLLITACTRFSHFYCFMDGASLSLITLPGVVPLPKCVREGRMQMSG